MKQPILKFSVIIPVYNVPEAYLRQSLDSVQAQTYANLEVLLVIDGATDDSPQVCREYAQNDCRFTVHEKVKSGAGATRNYAIDRAAGDYILFVDSDDYWLDSYFVDKVANLLAESNADVLSFGYSEFYRESEAPTGSTQGELDRTEVFGKSASFALGKLLKTSRSNFSSSIITKCVKASLLRDNNIRFIEGINGEDSHFTAQLLICAKNYDRLNEHVYAVRRHTGSTSRMSVNACKVAESILKVFDDLFSRYDLRSVGYEQILDFLSSPYLYALGKLAVAYDSELLESIAKYKFVLRHSSRSYVKAAGIFADTFGLKLLVSALRVFLTFNKKSHAGINRQKEEK
jgi:glycosyltransferase involved in cell wall biosynthesis